MARTTKSILLLPMLLAIAYASNATVDTERKNAAPMIMSIWDESRKEYPRSYALNDEFEGVELDGWVAGPAILSELMNDDRLERIADIVEIENCDFELDYSQGPTLLLPHFGKVKKAMHLLLAKARIHINAGQYADSVEVLHGCLVLVRHLSTDRSLMSVFARAEICRLTAAILLRIPVDDLLTLDTSALLHEIERMPAEDRFGIRQAMIFEIENFSDWVVDHSATVDGRDEIWDLLDSLATVGGGDVAPSRWKLGLLVAQFGGFEQTGRAFRDVGKLQAAALDLDDPIEELHRIMERVHAGEFGPLAPYFVSTIDRAVLQVQAAEPMLDLLEIILDEDARQGG